MKKHLILAGFVLLLIQQSLIGANVKAYFSYGVFNSVAKGPYVETYLTVLGNSLIFKRNQGKFQGSVEIFVAFKQEGKIVKANKYNLLSPEIKDTLHSLPNFIDQQRYALQNGKYDFEISIRDINKPGSIAFTSTEIIDINFNPNEVTFSDVQLLESYKKSENPGPLTKSGLDMVPYGINYYPKGTDKLSFYTEAYNSDSALGKDKKFLFIHYIESNETYSQIEGFHTFSKNTTNKVNVLMGSFDITNLATGNYNLVVELRDDKNIIQAQKKVFFQRTNPEAKIDITDIASVNPELTFISKYTNSDSLKVMIRCLYPISSTTERDWQNTQVKTADVKTMQQYLFVFWKNRNENNPEGAFKKYMQEVATVQQLFKYGKTPGYMSDRGRVYLQYGPPDARQEVPSEPESYPYEIWQLYRIVDPVTGQMQTNKKFVFANTEIADNKYTLIHSDARGELKDVRWQLRLKKRTNQVLNLDKETPNSNNFGSGADELFANPR